MARCLAKSMGYWSGMRLSRRLMMTSLAMVCIYVLWLQTAYYVGSRPFHRALLTQEGPEKHLPSSTTGGGGGSLRARTTSNQLRQAPRVVITNKQNTKPAKGPGYPTIRPMPSLDPNFSTFLLRSSLLTTTTTPNDVPDNQRNSLRTEDALILPFDRYVSSSRRLQIISVCQDHREYRGKRLPDELVPYTFGELRGSDVNMRVFQFHLILSRSYFRVGRHAQTVSEKMFKSIELWWTFASTEGDRSTTEPRLANNSYTIQGETYRMLPKAIKTWVPLGLDWRWKKKTEYLELLVRCVFELPEGVWLSMRALNVQARFAVFAGEDIAFFPLDHVIHFPRASTILPHSVLPAEPVNDNALTHETEHIDGNSGGGEGEQESKETKYNRDLKTIVRAQGEAAKARVGAWITKKFSWNDDDDLWLRWMIDVVGVDHIVLILAARDLDIPSVSRRIDQLDEASGEAGRFSSRITIMHNNASAPPTTFCYLQELHVMDIFTRWSEDFDYALLIDTDEFLQLFESSPPYRRIDIKTFIAHNKHTLKNDISQGFANFDRAVVTRRALNKDVEPLVGKLLQSIVLVDGHLMESLLKTVNVSWQGLGKALFDIDRTVLPYLHFAPGYSRTNWPVREAHILHIRQPFNDNQQVYGLESLLQNLQSQQSAPPSPNLINEPLSLFQFLAE